MANPIFLLVLLTLCGTCALGVPSDHQYKRYYIGEGSAASRTPVNHSVDLSLHLLRHLHSPSHNLVFSPYSLVTALTMTLLGAEGDSRRQLMETLFGSKNARWLEQFITQHSDLTKYSAEQLQMANFLYSDTRFPLKSEYSKEIASNLSGIAKTLSFADDPSSAMETINSDVSEATHGITPRLLTELNPSTALFLLNTVTFKGMWSMPFSKANTDLNGTFTKSPGAWYLTLLNNGGEVIQSPMMHHYAARLPFFEESDGTKSLLLPYNVPDTHLALFLPPEGTPIEAFLANLKPTYLENLTGAYAELLLLKRSRRVNVALPRFSISRTHSGLVASLKSLGVSDIFSPKKANLSKLTENWSGLAVDEVLQQATIEVNEEGPKGAATPAVRPILMNGTGSEFNFIADRPFVYAIVYTPSSPTSRFFPVEQTQILLMGVVEDPSSE